MVNLLWVFVEADWTKPLKGSRLTNRLLLDVSADQINTVNLTEGEARETLAFSAARTTMQLFASKAKQRTEGSWGGRGPKLENRPRFEQ